MTDHSELKKMAFLLRQSILKTAIIAGKGHIPPALSWVEIAVALFFSDLIKLTKKRNKNEDKNRFILSKGHGCLTLYAVLAKLKIIKNEDLLEFASNGSLLPGHPDIEIPGVENCSGSLGHGLSVGAGMALSYKLKSKKNRIYVLLGDGECHEGSIWEAVMFAGFRKLDNLVAIIDKNNLGATDFTKNYLSIDPIEDKFKSFGWETKLVNGHNINQIYNSLKYKKINKPLCIVANTVKGKGLQYMENSKNWHHQMPNKEQIELTKNILDIKL